jgi:hypothetical protein
VVNNGTTPSSTRTRSRTSVGTVVVVPSQTTSSGTMQYTGAADVNQIKAWGVVAGFAAAVML